MIAVVSHLVALSSRLAYFKISKKIVIYIKIAIDHGNGKLLFLLPAASPFLWKTFSFFLLQSQQKKGFSACLPEYLLV